MKKPREAASGTRSTTIGDTRYTMKKIGTYGDSWQITANGYPISAVSDYHSTLKQWDGLMTQYGSNPSVRKIGDHIRSLEDAYAFLDGKLSKKLANNTVVTRNYDNGSVAVILHRTAVVTYTYGGWIVLDSGGYHSVTTKQRINQLLPLGWRLSQEDFDWTVTTPTGDHDFADGITFRVRDGELIRWSKHDNAQGGGEEGDGHGYKNMGGDPTYVQSPKHRANPIDEEGREYEVLEPNWHNMGRWALNGLGFYINDKGGLRKKLNPSDRQSVIALMSTACASAFYVHDIGTELLLLLKVKKQAMSFGGEQDTIMLDMVQTFVQVDQKEWSRVRLLAGEAAYREQWGRLANVLSDAIAGE